MAPAAHHLSITTAAQLLHVCFHLVAGDSDLQCAECGLCFTVLPALKRHLIIVHKVKDFDRYGVDSGVSLSEMEANARRPTSLDSSFASSTCSDSSFDAPLSSYTNGAKVSSPTKASAKRKPAQSRVGREAAVGDERSNPLKTLQCNVCYKTFDEAGKLRKHMRAHGMAFIFSKRAQSARR